MASVLKSSVVLALSVLLLLGAPANAQLASPTTQFLMSFTNTIPNLAALWSDPDYCKFSGVTCDPDGLARVRLDLVSIKGFKLVGTLPEIPANVNGALVKIREMNLNGLQKIRGAFPSTWGALTNMERMDFTNTKLWGQIPHAWTTMSNLSAVVISGTNACVSLPNWTAAAMPKLAIADFSYNKMYGSLSANFGSFSNRAFALNLRGNNFCGCIPSTWTSVDLLNAARDAKLSAASAGCAAQNACSDLLINRCPLDAAFMQSISPLLALLLSVVVSFGLSVI